MEYPWSSSALGGGVGGGVGASPCTRLVAQLHNILKKGGEARVAERATAMASFRTMFPPPECRRARHGLHDPGAQRRNAKKRRCCRTPSVRQFVAERRILA